MLKEARLVRFRFPGVVEPAREIGVPAHQGETILSALSANGALRGDQPAMRRRDSTGRWQTTTWSEYEGEVRRVGAGLASLGIGRGDRVGVLASNRPEWHLSDLGAMANGSVTVPIYPTSSPTQVSYALGHSRASICIVDSHEQLGKVIFVRDRLPDLKRVVVIDSSRRATDTFIIGFDELRLIGADHIDRDPAASQTTLAAVAPDDLATIVYTSGTTGPPKGAMVTHRNIMWTLRQVAPVYGIGSGERLISYLPLSHIAERMMSDFMPIAVGGETWFARSLATLSEDLPDCRPTVFLGVPRVWEKLRSAIEDQLAGKPFPVRSAVQAYLTLGHRVVDAQQAQDGLPPAARELYLAMDRLIGAAIRGQIGLDRCRIPVSAAAPIHPDLIRWFHAIGLPLLQIYGQTEDCGPTTASRIDANHIGTVGSPVPGVNVTIADDGEILVKGRNVCRGYLDDPAATAELIDADGWMHTGDLGRFDDNGDMRITGRKKDLIITAAGKNISPQEIETDLAVDPLVSEAVVVGEGRKYLTALMTLDPEELSRWAVDHNKLDDSEALSQDPDVLEHLQASVDAVNSRRSQAEWIRKFRVLPNELTAAAGELTPTMKVKRSVVCKRYAGFIEEMYGAA